MQFHVLEIRTTELQIELQEWWCRKHAYTSM